MIDTANANVCLSASICLRLASVRTVYGVKLLLAGQQTNKAVPVKTQTDYSLTVEARPLELPI